jgi:hypothetical protein
MSHQPSALSDSFKFSGITAIAGPFSKICASWSSSVPAMRLESAKNQAFWIGSSDEGTCGPQPPGDTPVKQIDRFLLFSGPIFARAWGWNLSSGQKNLPGARFSKEFGKQSAGDGF